MKEESKATRQQRVPHASRPTATVSAALAPSVVDWDAQERRASHHCLVRDPSATPTPTPTLRHATASSASAASLS
jgi:hypothetical protein